MSEPMERHISITSTTTNTNGVVTQVTHASVHVVASGDCFDPETCCDERERALIAAMRAYLRPKHAPQSLMRHSTTVVTSNWKDVRRFMRQVPR